MLRGFGRAALSFFKCIVWPTAGSVHMIMIGFSMPRIVRLVHKFKDYFVPSPDMLPVSLTHTSQHSTSPSSIGSACGMHGVCRKLPSGKSTLGVSERSSLVMTLVCT